MSLEPWVDHDKRRGTHVVRWRNAAGEKERDKFVYHNRRDAKERVNQIRQGLVNQSLGRIDLTRSPKECADAYLKELESKTTVDPTMKATLNRFLSLRESSGRVAIQTLADITRSRILNYMTALRMEKLSEHTVQTYMGRLRTWLGWCVDHQWLPALPYVKIGVKTPRKLDRFFTDNELAAFEAAIDNEEFRCLFQLGYRSGLRPAECLRISDEHVAWDPALKRGELYIPPDEAKTNKSGRYAELSERTYELFPKKRGLLFANWTKQRMDRHYAKAKAKAGIQDKVVKDRKVYKTFYWTRHTYAKRYLERGGSPKRLADRMGHTTIKTTVDTYGHLERTVIQDVHVPEIYCGANVPAENIAGHRRGKLPENGVILGHAGSSSINDASAGLGQFLDGKSA